jgi:hypothetical protein
MSAPRFEPGSFMTEREPSTELSTTAQNVSNIGGLVVNTIGKTGFM